MSFDLNNTWDSIKDGLSETAEIAHTKTNEFHEKYVSKITPDCGKYGDAVKFAAEMVPGVSEYNAIKDGDWQAFAIAAGIDIASFVIGCGVGYAGAKAGMKIAVKEIAEAGAEKAIKEVVEAGIEKTAKEVTESAVKKTIKETTETVVEKTIKEVAETGTEKLAKETIEAGTKKIAKETAEAGTEKAVKESTEKAVSKATKEVGEKIDKTLISDYLDEVEKITGRDIPPNQLEKLKKVLLENDFAKMDSESTKLRRKLFDNARDRLINEWEINTGKKWPTYVEDILSDTGEILRRQGQRYDAHHLIELSFGGPNAWWNLHPAAYLIEHQSGIHAAGSLANLIF